MTIEDSNLADKIYQRIEEIADIELEIKLRMRALDRKLDDPQLSTDDRYRLQQANHLEWVKLKSELPDEYQKRGDLVKASAYGLRPTESRILFNQENRVSDWTVGYQVTNYGLRQTVRVYSDDLKLLRDGVIRFTDIHTLDGRLITPDTSEELLKSFFKID